MTLIGTSISDHLTVVFATLAIGRHLQEATGVSIKTLVRTSRPTQNVAIEIAGHTLTVEPTVTPAASHILSSLQYG
jgi:hypothetical protein